MYDDKEAVLREDEPLKTLYLLHGWDGSHEDWIHHSRIVKYATTNGIAVIMPSGENSFYVNQPNESDYGRYVGEELVVETRKLFNLSQKREDTWIGGLSMGGYGALRNGLLFSQTFGKIAALSSPVLTKSCQRELKEDTPINKRVRHLIGGSSYRMLPKDMDIKELLSNVPNQKIYLACGTEDFLYEDSKELHQWMTERNYAHTYHESTGEHNWSYWNNEIQEVIKWLLTND